MITETHRGITYREGDQIEVIQRVEDAPPTTSTGQLVKTGADRLWLTGVRSLDAIARNPMATIRVILRAPDPMPTETELYVDRQGDVWRLHDAKADIMRPASRYWERLDGDGDNANCLEPPHFYGPFIRYAPVAEVLQAVAGMGSPSNAKFVATVARQYGVEL